MSTAPATATNFTTGTKTIHAVMGSWGDNRYYPFCSVATAGKTLTLTDKPVTCKTCAKHVAR